MGHNHSHNHAHHHEHNHEITSLNGIYILSIVLNLAFVFVETGVGIWSKSLGLVSDAGHNLSDVFSLLLALIAFKLAATAARKGFTYGYKKASILISLLNAVILLVAVGVIVFESIEKFMTPAAGLDGGAIAWTAGIGILINGATAYMLMRKQEHDINTRGAFLHMAADTLVSVGVVVSGLIIKFTGFTMIDPIISLIIAAIILVSTWSLLKESIRMAIDAVPEGVEVEKIEEAMRATEGVEEIHHVHVWPISTTETALTAHICVSNYADGESIVPAVKKGLKEIGITHATIEVETAGGHCADMEKKC